MSGLPPDTKFLQIQYLQGCAVSCPKSTELSNLQPDILLKILEASTDDPIMDVLKLSRVSREFPPDDTFEKFNQILGLYGSYKNHKNLLNSFNDDGMKNWSARKWFKYAVSSGQLGGEYPWLRPAIENARVRSEIFSMIQSYYGRQVHAQISAEKIRNLSAFLQDTNKLLKYLGNGSALDRACDAKINELVHSCNASYLKSIDPELSLNSAVKYNVPVGAKELMVRILQLALRLAAMKDYSWKLSVDRPGHLGELQHGHTQDDKAYNYARTLYYVI